MAGHKLEAHAPEYPIHLYRDPDSGDWVAEVSDLPGCVGVGDSPAKALASATRNTQVWLDGARENGWPIPRPTRHVEASGKLHLRLPPPMHARLQQLAEREGVSINQQIVAAVAEYLGAEKLYAALVARMEAAMIAATYRGTASSVPAVHEPLAASRGVSVVGPPPAQASRKGGKVKGPRRPSGLA